MCQCRHAARFCGTYSKETINVKTNNVETLDLQTQIENLQLAVRKLLHVGDGVTYVYIDDFTRLNQEIHQLITLLYNKKGKSADQEASLCLALLMGYSVSMYANPSDEKKRQIILNRSSSVLQKLPSSFLKCQLLIYCYGEVYEEELAQEAHSIINSWGNRVYTDEEKEVVETLETMERCPYPHWGIAN